MDVADLSPLVALLRAALAKHSKRLVFVQIQFFFADSTSELHTLPGAIVPVDAPRPPGEEVSRSVTDTERAVLELLARAEKPIKGRTVASRLGRSYSSHLRETLADMIRRGQLVHGRRGGYWPADRPLPLEAPDD